MPRGRFLRVVVCRVGHAPQERRIARTLGALQEIVGGYVESVHIGNGLDLLCNEDGISLGLPFNRTVPGRSPIDIYGDFLVVRRQGDEHVSLLGGDVAHLYRLFGAVEAESEGEDA